MLEVAGSREEEPKTKNRRLTKTGSSVGDANSDLERFDIAHHGDDLEQIDLYRDRM